MAASEFLAEQVDPDFPKTLLDTIRACSETLLDTFEQILDFTKINSFKKKRRNPNLRLHGDQSAASSHAEPESLHILKATNVVAIIEDVIESVFFGANLANRGLSGDPDSVGVEHVVDVSIDVAPGDWVFVLEPGALRRIVMNVFGNALKYTKEGSVSIRIEIQKDGKGPGNPTIDGCDVLLLTVSDTGKGISSEYLRSDLFTPFSQEDSLSPGTGLGLSLVYNILRYLNGNIKIKSQPGMGTVAKISVPLARLKRHERGEGPTITKDPLLQSLADNFQALKRELQGKTVCFVPLENTSLQSPLSALTISKYLTEWYGLRLQPWLPDTPADLVIINETQLRRITSAQKSKFLVLCRHGLPARSTIESLGRLHARVEWLNLPCGPHKLARAIQRCLQGPSFKPSAQIEGPHHLPMRRDFGDKSGDDKLSLIDKQGSHAIPLQSPTQQGRAQVQLSSKAEIFQSDSAPHDADIRQLKVHSQPKGKGSSGRELTASPARSEGLRILLVEDNPINMALLRKLVARRQPTVLHTAVDGRKAVDAVKMMAEGYHLIFMGKLHHTCYISKKPIVSGFTDPANQ